MKKLVLAITLAVAGLAVSNAEARFFSSNCCQKSCEVKCCEPVKCCKQYKVIDETPCEAPVCERYVRVTEPAICIRSCRWVCPEGTTECGQTEGGEFKLVGGQDHHKLAN